MTPLWAEGQPITVEADDWGTPQRFTWRGVVHPVAEVVNRWRVDEGWWTETSFDSGEKASLFSTSESDDHDNGRVWREYFRLVTVSGLLVDVYRDMAGEGWYLQRVYD
jgi:hypothetical protein